MEINPVVPYDIALALKELGFDQLCHSYYWHQDSKQPAVTYCKNSEPWLGKLDCAAPDRLQAMEWFQTKFGLFLSIQADQETAGYYTLQIIGPFIAERISGRPVLWDGDGVCYLYENTIPYILRKAIELVTVGIFKEQPKTYDL